MKSAETPQSPRKTTLERFQCGLRAYQRWNALAGQLGEKIPWEEGPAAVRVWCNRHGRKIPQWLTDAELRDGGEKLKVRSRRHDTTARNDDDTGDTDDSDTTEGSAPDAGALETVDALLEDCGRRIKEARRQKAAPSTLAAMGRDFAKLVEARAKVSAARRQEDDGLVPLAEVTRIVDEVHAAIPDRIEQSLLKSDADARSALDAGTWRQFCERFRNHALADLSRSFAESLNANNTK